MTNPSDIPLELMRRQLAGESIEDLKRFFDAAILGSAADADSPLYGWAIRTAAHALEPKEPLKYLVDQLLAYPSLSIVYGGPGSLKSMILADLCACVAGGKRWLDTLPVDGVAPGTSLATTQAPVLWVDFDNGARRTDMRIGAILRAHGLDASTPLDYVSMPVPSLDASKAHIVEAFTELVKQRGYKLIVIDNLGLITGDTEENGAGMANVMGRLRRLAEEGDCAVVLIHHQRKSSAGGDANGIRKGETLRGHSSIEASLDLALLIERKPGEDSVAIIATKVRDFISFGILGARFTYEHFDGTRDLEKARFFSTVTQTPEDHALDMLRNVISDEVASAPGILTKDLVSNVRDTMAAMRDAKNVGVNTVRGTIKKMVDDGLLKRTGSNAEGRYYKP